MESKILKIHTTHCIGSFEGKPKEKVFKFPRETKKFHKEKMRMCCLIHRGLISSIGVVVAK